MADIHDYLEAARETDAALTSLDVYGRAIEEGREGDAALALLIAARAVVSAIREASTRADYVAREGRS